MTNKKKFEFIKSFYNNNYDEYTNSIKTIGWSNKNDQNLRFSKLIQNLELNKKKILDVGCGFGDLFFFLEKKYKKKNINYTGIDISNKIINHTKKIIKNKTNKPKLVCGNFYGLKMKKYDIILSSGSMSLNINLGYNDLEKMLRKMFNDCNYCITLNFLSSYSDYQLKKNQHFSPEKIFKIAKKISKKVNLIHDYDLYEFTVQIIK